MRFVSIGEALVDLVAGTDGSFTAHAGGSPFNVAVTLGRLGARVSMSGAVGADAFGAVLTACLTDSGVDLDLWRTVAAPTSLAVATLAADGGASYSFYFDGTAGLDFTEAPAPGDGGDVDVLAAGSIASWFGEGSARVRDALARARSGGATLVCYDPNVRGALIDDVSAVRDRIETCVAAAHLVKASDEDVAFLYPAEPIEEVVARWHRIGAVLVVLTRGAAGAVASAHDGVLCDLPAVPIDVVDTVGAGDSFTGGLLWALGRAGLASPAALTAAVERADPALTAAVETAIAVAAVTSSRAGANPPTAAELAAFRG